MSTADATTVAEFFLAGGAVSVFAAVVQKLFGRRKDRVDAAAVVQEAALELLGPVRAELRQAREDASAARVQVAQLRQEMSALQTELSEWIAWAQMAKRELDAHGIEIAPIPARRASGW